MIKQNLIKRIEKEIEKTPTGSTRELLSDINIYLHALTKQESDLLNDLKKSIYSRSADSKFMITVLEKLDTIIEQTKRGD